MERLHELEETVGKSVKSTEIVDKRTDMGNPVVKVIFNDECFIEIASRGYEDGEVELWVVQGISNGRGGIQ